MFVSPMLLQKAKEPFNNDLYITELKLDGIRLVLSKFNNKIKLYTRHKTDVTNKFPELHSIDVPNGTVLDGELIVTDKEGKPDFESVMSRFQSTRLLEKKQTVSYVVFDVLQYNAITTTNFTLLQRKQLLEKVIPQDTDLISKVKYVEGFGSAYFDLVKEQGLEGIVLKPKDSKYEVGKRSKSWLKIINYQYKSVYISAIRKGEFGVLLNFLNGQPAGIMEYMPLAERKKLYSLKRVLSEDDKFIYIEPIKCNVKYRNLTKAGYLRIPSFVKFE